VVGFWVLLALLLAAYAGCLLRAPRTLAGLALSCAVVMWALDLGNKQSFFNHYTLPLGLIVVTLAAMSSGARAENLPVRSAAASSPPTHVDVR
jgi:hypothetical protein